MLLCCRCCCCVALQFLHACPDLARCAALCCASIVAVQNDPRDFAFGSGTVDPDDVVVLVTAQYRARAVRAVKVLGSTLGAALIDNEHLVARRESCRRWQTFRLLALEVVAPQGPPRVAERPRELLDVQADFLRRPTERSGRRGGKIALWSGRGEHVLRSRREPGVYPVTLRIDAARLRARARARRRPARRLNGCSFGA